LPSTAVAAVDIDAGDAVSGSGNITHTITGLVNGVAYTCYASASNAIGSSPPSQTTVGPVNVGTYPAPGNVQASVSNGQGIVTFNPQSPALNDPISGYTVSAFPVSAAPGAPAVVKSFCTTSPCSVPGLPSAGSYIFVVQTLNVNGNGGGSPPVTVNMPPAQSSGS
jgi:hypothetical protein